MGTIRLSVKGVREDAEKVLRERGVEATFVKDYDRPTSHPFGAQRSTFWDADETERSKIVHWFCDTNESLEHRPLNGYPPGTLLFHT